MESKNEPLDTGARTDEHSAADTEPGASVSYRRLM